MADRRYQLGLHTEEEQGRALNMASEAYERALHARRRSDAVAMSFEIGYIRAISDLAEAEGASSLVRLTRDQVERLDALLVELKR